MAFVQQPHMVCSHGWTRGLADQGSALISPSPNRSTGQDAAAVIKKELQHLLPGIKIFLDVRTYCSR